ncbi:dnaJ homolog subfamily C member 1 [Ixodes scapularis]|uniref:dnaJ homolog subfamily C member 1 n=1 Tax=Ixodes scapularis TaxID=6945 RepID=UPI001C38D74C|nr:dnaJ homolog subfamily C member 1 [Ixodes scapularis]
MYLRMTRYVIFATFLFYGSVSAWTQEDLELFDVVEDVNENFYSFLGLSKDVDTAGIKKAYRKLSLQYHPDKNKEQGSEDKFRKIVAVVEILKDEEKRKKYHSILENGLPDWRQPVFYYRRVRKMGMSELCVFLLVLVTLGQHVVAWAAYWERKFELEETVLAKFKRRDKRSKKANSAVEDEIRASYIESLEKPQYRDLLVVRLVLFLAYVVRNLPSITRECLRQIQERRNRVVEEASSEDEAYDDRSERERRPKRRVRVIPEASEVTSNLSPPSTESSTSRESEATCSDTCKTPWSEDDTVALIRAMKKYPTGTVERWQKIADLLNRTADEVILVMKQLKKSNLTANIVPHAQGVTAHDYESVTAFDQAPTIRLLADSADGGAQPLQKADDWSQAQQKCMEAALQRFPKGTEDRWDRIAEAVPGKSREDCMLRFKFLVEALRRRKVEEKSKTN